MLDFLHFQTKPRVSLSDIARLKNNRIKPITLLMLDGYGIAPTSAGNAITQAKKPNIERIIKSYPSTQLIAAGESVGLPANEAGNSEVGHLTIGVGRVIYQSLPRINMAIKDGSFYENPAFIKAINYSRSNNSKIHIMGMVSSGTVHSSNTHLYALLDMCQRNGVGNINLHLFTDGRDAPPTDGINMIKEIDAKLADSDLAKIRTVCGRYYAMDRDARWDRTKKAYDAIVMARGLNAKSASDAIDSSYARGLTDEFIEPTIISDDKSPYTGVNDNDVIIFFNFRIDRPRQLTMAFVFPDFEKLKMVEFGYLPHEWRGEKDKSSGPTFKREKVPANIFFVTMTEYQRNLPVSAIAFPPSTIENSVTQIFSNLGYKQMHLAESEKERMVTYYFDGMHEERAKGEDVVIVPSPKIATYDKKPEMSINRIMLEYKKAVLKDCYQFIVMNFANPDMVAHTGNLNATISAIEAVDEAVGMLTEITLATGGSLFITADHGNAEELLTYPVGTFFYTSQSGSKNTEHSNNPVPFYIVAKIFEGKTNLLVPGSLADVAPTILAVANIKTPQEMTGRSLLKTG